MFRHRLVVLWGLIFMAASQAFCVTNEHIHHVEAIRAYDGEIRLDEVPHLDEAFMGDLFNVDLSVIPEEYREKIEEVRRLASTAAGVYLHSIRVQDAGNFVRDFITPHFPRLKKLSICFGDWTKFNFDAILAIPGLEEFELWVNNDFSANPEALTAGISRLINLKRLRYRGPGAPAIDLSGFSFLEWLDLSNNNLTKIPRGFETLPNLKVCNLSGNSLQQVPDFDGWTICTNIYDEKFQTDRREGKKVLIGDDNLFEKIANDLLLKTSWAFNLDVDAFEATKEMNLAWSHLNAQRLSNIFSDGALVSAELRGGILAFLDQRAVQGWGNEVLKFEGMRKILAHQLDRAERFFRIKQLVEVLDVSDNPFLTELPECIRGLKYLKKIDLTATGIRAVPEWLVAMPSVQEIMVSEGVEPFHEKIKVQYSVAQEPQPLIILVNDGVDQAAYAEIPWRGFVQKSPDAVCQLLALALAQGDSPIVVSAPVLYQFLARRNDFASSKGVRGGYHALWREHPVVVPNGDIQEEVFKNIFHTYYIDLPQYGISSPKNQQEVFLADFRAFLFNNIPFSEARMSLYKTQQGDLYLFVPRAHSEQVSSLFELKYLSPVDPASLADTSVVDGITKNISTLNVKSLMNIFKPRSGNWMIYMAGHGSRASDQRDARISGVGARQFKKLLEFFNVRVKTSFLYYLSCFSGGANLMEVPPVNFFVVPSAVTDEPSYEPHFMLFGEKTKYPACLGQGCSAFWRNIKVSISFGVFFDHVKSFLRGIKPLKDSLPEATTLKGALPKVNPLSSLLEMVCAVRGEVLPMPSGRQLVGNSEKASEAEVASQMTCIRPPNVSYFIPVGEAADEMTLTYAKASAKSSVMVEQVIRNLTRLKKDMINEMARMVRREQMGRDIEEVPFNADKERERSSINAQKEKEKLAVRLANLDRDIAAAESRRDDGIRVVNKRVLHIQPLYIEAPINIQGMMPFIKSLDVDFALHTLESLAARDISFEVVIKHFLPAGVKNRKLFVIKKLICRDGTFENVVIDKQLQRDRSVIYYKHDGFERATLDDVALRVEVIDEESLKQSVLALLNEFKAAEVRMKRTVSKGEEEIDEPIAPWQISKDELITRVKGWLGL